MANYSYREYQNCSAIYSECGACKFEGEGFKLYDEKQTTDNSDHVREIWECPKCKHGNI